MLALTDEEVMKKFGIMSYCVDVQPDKPFLYKDEFSIVSETFEFGLLLYSKNNELLVIDSYDFYHDVPSDTYCSFFSKENGFRDSLITVQDIKALFGLVRWYIDPIQLVKPYYIKRFTQFFNRLLRLENIHFKVEPLKFLNAIPYHDVNQDGSLWNPLSIDCHDFDGSNETARQFFVKYYSYFNTLKNSPVDKDSVDSDFVSMYDLKYYAEKKRIIDFL